MDEREEVFLSSLVREDTNKRAKKKRRNDRCWFFKIKKPATGGVRTQIFTQHMAPGRPS